MFKSIQQLFTSKKNKKQQPSYQSVSNSRQVTKEKKIYSLLKQAYQNNVLFTIKLPETNGIFQTAITGIYPDQGYLTLDEISPIEGKPLFLKQNESQLSGRLDGVALAFKTSLVDAGEKSDTAHYRATIPTSLYFLQRRKHFRAAMSSTQIAFHAYRTVNEREALVGYIFDISTVGIGVILNDVHAISRGDLIPTCTLRLPGQGNLVFSLQISFSHPNSEREVTRIGGQFEDMDKTSQRKLRKIINQNERIHAKRNKKR